MERYEQIRRGVVVDGKSQREVARELRHSRKTVKKALAHSSPPGYQRKKPVPRPVIDQFAPVIDAWMEEDRKRPRKQRHTAERIYQRLKEEHDFPGSVSAVRRYVAMRKRTMGGAFFPLSFEPGEEGQVDWGQAWYLQNGVETKVHLFCMRTGYAGASFVRAYRDEKQECFLDGHVQAFRWFEAIPNRLAYDNEKTIVIKVGKGQERKLTDPFLAMRSHYLFQTRFCNIRSGNEKGHVENLVKHAQRSFMTPLPNMSSIDELNAYLLDCCEKDLKRKASHDPRTRGELLVEERQKMLPLPKTDFEACKRISTFATKQALVRFEKYDYSVPVAFAHRAVTLKGFPDRVELFHRDEKVASHERVFGDGGFALDPYHYIPLLRKKPGGLHGGRPFKGEPFGEDLERMRRELEYRYDGEGTKKYIQILLLFSKYPEGRVKEAVRECLRLGAISEEAVFSQLSFKPPQRIGEMDLSARPELQSVGQGIRPVAEYGALLLKEAN